MAEPKNSRKGSKVAASRAKRPAFRASEEADSYIRKPGTKTPNVLDVPEEQLTPKQRLALQRDAAARERYARESKAVSGRTPTRMTNTSKSVEGKPPGFRGLTDPEEIARAESIMDAEGKAAVRAANLGPQVRTVPGRGFFPPQTMAEKAKAAARAADMGIGTRPGARLAREYAAPDQVTTSAGRVQSILTPAEEARVAEIMAARPSVSAAPTPAQTGQTFTPRATPAPASAVDASLPSQRSIPFGISERPPVSATPTLEGSPTLTAQRTMPRVPGSALASAAAESAAPSFTPRAPTAPTSPTPFFEPGTLPAPTAAPTPGAPPVTPPVVGGGAPGSPVKVGSAQWANELRTLAEAEGKNVPRAPIGVTAEGAPKAWRIPGVTNAELNAGKALGIAEKGALGQRLSGAMSGAFSGPALGAGVAGMGAKFVGGKINSPDTPDEEGFGRADAGQFLEGAGQVGALGAPAVGALVGAGVLSGPVGWTALGLGALGYGLWNAFQGKEDPTDRFDSLAKKFGTDPKDLKYIKTNYDTLVNDMGRDPEVVGEQMAQLLYEDWNQRQTAEATPEATPSLTPKELLALQGQYADTIKQISDQGNAMTLRGLADTRNAARAVGGTMGSTIESVANLNAQTNAQLALAAQVQALQAPFQQYYDWVNQRRDSFNNQLDSALQGQQISQLINPQQSSQLDLSSLMDPNALMGG